MDETLWHKVNPIFPHRMIDGQWTYPAGQVWRRKFHGKWQYKQDEETEADAIERQW